jgi:hypothetical protein
MTITTNTALRFSVDDSHARELKPGEYYYRIELTDGREALIAAENITTESGALIARTENYNTLVIAPGAWVSVYMCEAMMAYDPWSILHLAPPNAEA